MLRELREPPFLDFYHFFLLPAKSEKGEEAPVERRKGLVLGGFCFLFLWNTITIADRGSG
jgi:hypothetical protein